MSEELKTIKKLYGEKMMKFCRDSFSTILEETWKLTEILKKTFFPTKFLYDDLVNECETESFKNFIFNKYITNNRLEKKGSSIIKSPEELLSKAGYNLYKCETETDIQSFRHYYHRREKTPTYDGIRPERCCGEELCTFNGGRLNSCYVFFAVKNNADELKRDDFTLPRREDKYGISVISIQFARGNTNTVSIKSRYNHTVENPDATFSNNLDNIVPGLTEAFETYYGLNINKTDDDFELHGYVFAEDGRFYKYNYEINNIYYCTDNIIIDNYKVITKYHDKKERYVLIDYFILDLEKKIIGYYDTSETLRDSFTSDLQHINDIRIKKKDNDEKEIEIIKKNDEKVYITIDKESRIIKYRNEYIKDIGEWFLHSNEVLKSIEIPNVKSIGSYFLYSNLCLNYIDIPNVEVIGCDFIYWNNSIKYILMDSVKKIGIGFMGHNRCAVCIKMPNAKIIGSNFMCNNTELDSIYIPKAEIICDYFLGDNQKLTRIYLPSVKYICGGFLHSSEKIKEIIVPSNVRYSNVRHVEKLKTTDGTKLDIDEMIRMY